MIENNQSVSQSKRNLALLMNRNFRKLWSAGLIHWTVFGIEQLATSIYIFSLTQSPLIVTSLLAVRMIPMIILGSIAGAISDRYPPLTLLSIGYWILAIVFFGLGSISLFGQIQVWYIFLGAVITGSGLTLDNVVRRKAIGELAAEKTLGPAMSLDITLLMLAMLLGPLFGGILFEQTGLTGVYWFIGLCFIFVNIMTRRIALPSLNQSSEISDKKPNLLSEIREGLKYARSNRIIFGTLMITMIMNVFILALYGLVPIVGIDILELNPSVNGILLSCNGLGGFIGALLISIYGPQRQYRRYYFWGSILLSVTILSFAFSDNLYLSIILLTVGGFGLAGFGTMQVTLLLLETPSYLRARILGLLTVCIGVGPIGALHIGYMAEQFGTINGLVIVAIEGLIIMAIAGLMWPELRKPAPPKM